MRAVWFIVLCHLAECDSTLRLLELSKKYSGHFEYGEFDLQDLAGKNHRVLHKVDEKNFLKYSGKKEDAMKFLNDLKLKRDENIVKFWKDLTLFKQETANQPDLEIPIIRKVIELFDGSSLKDIEFN